MGTLQDLEVRVAALEAGQADYRAVLTAVNALGATQREHSIAISDVKADVSGLKADVAGLKIDVSGLKTDVAGLKTDVADLKADVAELKTDVAGLKIEVTDLRQEMRAGFRSTDEQLAELKDLIIGRRDNG